MHRSRHFYIFVSLSPIFTMTGFLFMRVPITRILHIFFSTSSRRLFRIKRECKVGIVESLWTLSGSSLPFKTPWRSTSKFMCSQMIIDHRGTFPIECFGRDFSSLVKTSTTENKSYDFLIKMLSLSSFFFISFLYPRFDVLIHLSVKILCETIWNMSLYSRVKAIVSAVSIIFFFFFL